MTNVEVYRESRSNLRLPRLYSYKDALKTQEVYDRIVTLTSGLTQDQIEKINLKGFNTSSLRDMLSFCGDTLSFPLPK